MGSACHTLQCLLYPWQWIGVFLGACIEPTKIHTEVQCTILLPGQIAPTSNISQSKAHTPSNSGGGKHLNCSLNGSLSVIQISCSTVLVHPSSLASNAKTSWKVSTSSCAAVAFWGVQLLSPSRLSFSRGFLCCSATNKDGHLSSIPRAASISGESSAVGTGNAETTWAACMPYFRKTGDSDMFLIITDTLLLLILCLVYVCRTCNPRGSSCAPRLSGPSPQRCHHHLGTLPMRGLNLHSMIWVWNGPSFTFSFM